MNDPFLGKAISKAIANGWKPDVPKDADIFTYIYNHSFAKALWGEVTQTDGLWQKTNPPAGTRPWLLNVMPAWELHLKEMVVSPDPIKYLGEHL